MKLQRLISLICLTLFLYLIGSGNAATWVQAKNNVSPQKQDQFPWTFVDWQQQAFGINCPALPAASGTVINITNEADLRAQAMSAAAGTTLLLANGTYYMSDYLHILNGITIRSASGAAQDVILDFGGMSGGHFGTLVDANDITLAELTIRNANDHGISVQGVDRPTLYRLIIYDTGDQLVKVNPLGDGSEDGLLACSILGYTSSDPDGYTNGISAHYAHRWTVRDNIWYQVRGPDNITGPAILFWSESSDTIVERNILYNCYQGIAFGNASHSSTDHYGGIVRNNFIYSDAPNDVSIEMVHAQNWLVAHNTVFVLGSESGLTWSIEARYPDSTGSFAYNLTNMDIWADRDGGQGSLTGNLTNAAANWFANPDYADLHLNASATAAVDQAAPIAEVSDDIDGTTRPEGDAPDIGADEYQYIPPPVGGDSYTVIPLTSQNQSNFLLVTVILGAATIMLLSTLYMIKRAR